jgi:hypothetical protein
MKNTLLLSSLSFFLILLNNPAFSTVWRVNNSPGVDADFSSVQTAHDNAMAGDTLYLEASINSYGNLNVIKPLIIIGPGYNFASNDSTQANTNVAQIIDLTLSNGAQGSVIEGLSIIFVEIATDSITIRRNRIKPSNGYVVTALHIYSGFSNINIEQNFITQVYSNSAYKVIQLDGFNDNISITTNILINNSGGYKRLCLHAYQLH